MTKPPLPIPPVARNIHDDILVRLRALIAADYRDCRDPGFQSSYRDVMELYDNYQRAVLAVSGYTPVCRPGCHICCCHWAEDIYSFEASIIASHIRSLPAEAADAIVESCRAAEAEYLRLAEITGEKLACDDYEEFSDEIDPDEILLNSFYGLRSRCPFLDGDDRCSIYDIRPLTCRAYINLGDPAACFPEMIHEDDPVTYILDLDFDANDLLDDLHRRYETFPGDTGLRSLVLKYLTRGG